MYAGFSREQDLQLLGDQIAAMEDGLKAALERISELESEPGGAGESS